MHLKSVTLTNFRCFDSLTVALHPHLTVIVAENAGGKTAVLDAIAKGLSAWNTHLSSADQRLEAIPITDEDLQVTLESTKRDKWSQKKADFAKISLSLRYDGSDYDWDVSHTRTPEVIVPGSVGLETIKSKAIEIREKIYKGDEDIHVPVFAYYNVHRGHANQEIKGRTHPPKIDYSERLAALVDSLSPELREFSEIVSWFKDAALDELTWEKKHTGPDGIPAKTSTYPGALPHLRDAFSAVLGDRISNPRWERATGQITVDFLTEDNQIIPLTFEQLSQGYASILALVFDLTQRLTVANPYYWSEYDHRHACVVEGLGKPLEAPAIVLIDELDLHLHPSWQQTILGDLTRAFPATQFIVTTHSPQIVSTVKPQNIRILRSDEDGKWIADDKAPNTYGHSNSRSLEAVMGGRAYPEHLQTVADLREYQRLVGAEQHDSPRAVELRAALEAVWGKNDPELQLVDIGIRKNEALRKLRAQQQ